MDFPISVRYGSQIAPVALMRLTETKDPNELLKEFDRDDIVIEGKLDGWKAQVIKAGGKVSIYSRRGEEVTANFPELVKALSGLPDGTLVEGELVYWHEGKQDVGKVTSLAGSSAENAAEKAKELPGEMKVHLYDILWHKGKNVASEPFSKRRSILQSAVKQGKTVQLTKQYPFSKWQDAMNEAVKSGGEGIVLKIKDKPYEYKARGQQEPKPKGIMYKYKGGAGKSDSDDYVVYDYETSEKGKLKALFGQYYKGKLYHISEISNFSKEDEEAIKNKLKKGLFVIEIGFQERQPGGLRHQRFLRFREDKKPKDATMNEFHVKHIDNFEPVKSNAVSDWVEGQIFSDETGTYDIGVINDLAKNNPVVSVPLSGLAAQLESREWGEYGPKDVLNNPEKYPEEMEMIRSVDLDCPIFIYKNIVIDGNHRLARAFMDGAESIRVKFITDEQMEQAKDKGRENEAEDQATHHDRFVSELIRILKEAGVPISAATIGGSGILGALGKKKVKDLDVNIESDEFEKILRHPDAVVDEMRPGQLRARFDTQAGEIEMFTGPWIVGEKDYMTDETPVAEIGGFRYWAPEHALEWKKQMGRPKDVPDIELLESVTKTAFFLSKRARNPYRELGREVTPEDMEEEKQRCIFCDKMDFISNLKTIPANYFFSEFDVPGVPFHEECFRKQFRDIIPRDHSLDFLTPPKSKYARQTGIYPLSKRATYVDEVLNILEQRHGPALAPMTFTGLKDVPGVDTKKAYQIMCMHESNCGYIVGDSGTSFGATQVQFGIFVNSLARHPQAARITGISSDEYRKLGAAWYDFAKRMRGVNIWVKVPVDEAAVREFMRTNPKAVVSRREGTTIKYSPGNAPGVVKVVGGQYVGYALDLAKLKEIGLSVDSPYVANELRLLTNQFITDGVVRNGIVKLLVAQNNPDTYSKFQQTFSQKNVRKNKELRELADMVTQQDFMNRIVAVTDAVRKSGYDTTAPGAYNIYQLLAVANGAGVGAVQNYLLKKKPFSGGQTQGFKRMNRYIEQVTGVASTDPPNNGMAGFGARVASLSIGRTAAEWEEEKTPVEPVMTNEMLAVYDITLRRLWEELYRNNEELLQQVWIEYEQELGRKIERGELPRLVERDVARHVRKHWRELPKRQALFTLSKRASFAGGGALYFPGQYADEIKSGKRQMTIRAGDVPVEPDEVARCMTYSGAHVCDVKITSKETMSIGRIRKAFGKHTAKSLEQKFGKDRRFVVVRFELFQNVNEADDEPPMIQFPENEHKALERRLRGGKGIYTTRISRERGRYKEGQEYMTPWGHRVRVVSVVRLDGVENHPFLDELTDEQKEQIGRHKYDLVRLEKVVRNKADDEDDKNDKKWEEVLVEKDDIKLTRKQIRAHYEKPDIRKKIMSRIKGRPVLVYLGVAKNQKILKRNHNGKQIVITNDDPEKSEDPRNYFYWTKRRLLAIHEVFGTKTDLGFVDLDIHGGYTFEQAKKYAHALAGKLKEKFGGTPILYQSGGSGVHVEFNLKDEVPINDLRKELKELLDEFNKDQKGVTTGVVKGSGMRSDVSTLHNKGSLRVPWSLGETYGKVKKPLEKGQDDDDYGNDTWGRRNISEPSFPPGDALLTPPVGTEVSFTGDVGSYNMSDDRAVAMSARGGLVRLAATDDIEEEYLWLWDGERLHTAARVLKDAQGVSKEIPAWHYDLAMKAGMARLDDRHPRGFVTFYRNRKPEITTYDRSFWELPSRLQNKLERAMNLTPGSYTVVSIDLSGYKVKETEAYDRLNTIWKIAAEIGDERVRKFWEEHPEMVEEEEGEGEEEEVGYGSEEEEEAARRPIKKTPPEPLPKPAPKRPPEPVAPKKPRIRHPKETFKDIIGPKPKTRSETTRLIDELAEELLGEIAPEISEPEAEPEVAPKPETAPESEPERETSLVEQMLAGEGEDIGKELLEQADRPEKQPTPSVFGPIRPLADDKGDTLSRWPTIEKVPSMSDEARRYFDPDSLSEGSSLGRLFINPRAYTLLRKEPHLVQSWILPAVIMTIGKKWFDINKTKRTIERTPFSMFDENDIEAIRRGAKEGLTIEDLPKAKKYIGDINKLLAGILQEYFARYAGTPIDRFCYKALRRAMVPIVAEDRHYKETRFPVCSVCRAQTPKSIEVPKMERTAIEKNLWTCQECQKKADQLESADLADITARVTKLGDSMSKTKDMIMQARVGLEDADTEELRQRAHERLVKSQQKYETLKLAMADLEGKRDGMKDEIRKLRAQYNVPYKHTWCPSETCPGMRVPLTAVDWEGPFWKTPAGQEARTALQETLGLMPSEEQPIKRKASETAMMSEPKGQEPPEWMLDIPFVCPHDGVRFTLRTAKGRGYGRRGGYLWKPYQRSEWEPKSERAAQEGAAEGLGVDTDADERLAYQQLGVLARSIFLKKYWDMYNSLMAYVADETAKGKPMSRIRHDRTYIDLQRKMALYDTARDFTALSSELFVGWLAGREFGRKFVQEGGKIRARRSIKKRREKTWLAEKRDEIYLPLLQQWVDRMLAEKGGYEKYHLEDWMANAERDGIPHLGDGTYFVARIEGSIPGKAEHFNGFECKLRAKAKGFSEPDARMLRVLGVWDLTDDDLKLLEKIERTAPGTLDGAAALQNSKTVRDLLKGKTNRIAEFLGHDYRKAALDMEEAQFQPGDFVLVKAFVIPGQYHWNPIDQVRGLRKDSDEDDMFYRLGQEATGQGDDPAYWRQLNKQLEDLDPKEMKDNLERFIAQRAPKPTPDILERRRQLMEKYRELSGRLPVEPKPAGKRPEPQETAQERRKRLTERYRELTGRLPKSDARDPLTSYKKKREFDETPEPKGEKAGENKHRFVIQLHEADKAKTHFDLRLENDEGAMSSWAVPKHKMPGDKEKLLAVKTEDHPLSYMRFEGEIPKGEYGAGTVERHDSGTYEEIEWGKSKIVFRLKGKKEKGVYNLVHTDGNRWLLMRAKEEDARDYTDEEMAVLIESAKERRRLNRIMRRERSKLRRMGLDAVCVSSTASGINIAGHSDIDFQVGTDDPEITDRLLEQHGIGFVKDKGAYRLYSYTTEEGVPVELKVRPKEDVEYQLEGLHRILEAPVEERHEQILKKHKALERGDLDEYERVKLDLYKKHRLMPPDSDWERIRRERKGE